MTTVQHYSSFFPKRNIAVSRFASVNIADLPKEIRLPEDNKTKKILRDCLTGDITVKTYAQTIKVRGNQLKRNPEGGWWLTLGPLENQRVLIQDKNIVQLNGKDLVQKESLSSLKSSDTITVDLPAQKFVFTDSTSTKAAKESNTERSSFPKFVQLLEALNTNQNEKKGIDKNASYEDWRAEKIYLVTRNQFIEKLLSKRRVDPLQVLCVKDDPSAPDIYSFHLDSKEAKNEIDDLKQAYNSRLNTIIKNIPSGENTFAVKVSPQSLVLVSPTRDDLSGFSRTEQEERVLNLIKGLSVSKVQKAGFSDDLLTWFTEKDMNMFNISIRDRHCQDLDAFIPEKQAFLTKMLQDPEAIIDGIIHLETLSKPSRYQFSNIAKPLLKSNGLTRQQLEKEPRRLANSREFWKTLFRTLNRLASEDKISSRIQLDNYLTKLFKSHLYAQQAKAKSANA